MNMLFRIKTKCINGLLLNQKRNHAVGRIVPNIYVELLLYMLRMVPK
jgi:hypothetical protein